MLLYLKSEFLNRSLLVNCMGDLILHVIYINVVCLMQMLLGVSYQGLPSEGVDPSEAKFRHITEMTILTVQLIVEFSKRLPGFDKLEREDQITLLKVRMLNCALSSFQVIPPLDEKNPLSYAGYLSDAAYAQITEMTILCVTLTVEFSKRLPGFDTLQREDQITLLKVSVL